MTHTPAPAPAPATTTHDSTGADEYDYTAFVLRTEQTYPAIDPCLFAKETPDAYRAQHGECNALLSCVVGIWTQLAIPTAGVAAMTGVLMGLLTRLETTGIGTLFDADHDDLLHFVTVNPTPAAPPTTVEMRLRRNTINAAFLALQDASLVEEPELLHVPQLAGDERSGGLSTLQGNPASQETRKDFDDQVHVRPATHDEVLLIRLATRLVGTSRGLHRAAAAVAACSSTATTSEAGQIIWNHHHQRDHRDQLDLVGRHGHTEASIAPRTVELDTWAAHALASWRAESGLEYPVNPNGPALHNGTKGLTSTSAGVSVDQQVKKAMTRAGLANVRGLSAGSLRLWATTKDATDVLSIRDGAARAGIRFATLHRLIHQLGESGV